MRKGEAAAGSGQNKFENERSDATEADHVADTQLKAALRYSRAETAPDHVGMAAQK
jgi:hypothetical protein